MNDPREAKAARLRAQQQAAAARKAQKEMERLDRAAKDEAARRKADKERKG